MITNEHVRDYLFSLEEELPQYLSDLEKEALRKNVPIIRRDVQSLLKYLLRKEKPEAVLEIGTAVGFSTLYMHEFAPSKTHITTIEKVEMRLKEARKNLAGKERITLIEEDAGKALERLAASSGRFDLVFLDAAKGQYCSWFDDILKVLVPGGLLVTDNCLLEGSIAESKFSIERRDRTIHKRMREYLQVITHHDELETVILPVGDGVAVSYRL
ncbi:MAG: O-methyltransferase [Lachnospiraceae bacterium]|nr:O-methyltransferase [Lachnospiraceae bacterium]